MGNACEERGKDSGKDVMKWKRILRSMLIAAGLVLLLQLTEWILNKNGLELRTAAQGVKGLYVWLIAPAIILIQSYRLLADKIKSGTGKGFMILLFVLLFVVLLGVDFFRGLSYVFSGELVEETVLEDGVIEGKYSFGLSETYTRYYDSVFGIFRRDFSGHDTEKITAVLRERYGVDAELVETPDMMQAEQEGVPGGSDGMAGDAHTSENPGFYIYRIPAGTYEEKYLYFSVENNYALTDNYLYRKMQQDAIEFWNGRRGISFSERETGDYYGSYEERWSKAEYAKAEDMLMVWCYGKEDIMDCAGDITNWIYYAVEEEYYGSPERGSELPQALGMFYIANGGDGFWFATGIPNGTDWTNMDAWEENRNRIAIEIQINAEYAGIWLDDGTSDNGAGTSDGAPEKTPEYIAAEEEQRNADFIARYNGDYAYEKECELSDGTVKYRMLVMDAACGSRLYGLIKSDDAGASWEVVSLDPFAGQSGMGIDFTFLDEKLGFATLTHNGGDEAELYVTEDGGRSYEPVTFQDVTVTLDNGYRYSPYDFPKMPYEKNGNLYVYCGQGADGDYAGGDAAGMAFYESTDGGHTWTYVETGLPEKPGD